METEHIAEILCKFKYSENLAVIWTVEYKMNWFPKYVQIMACDSVCIPFLVTATHCRLLFFTSNFCSPLYHTWGECSVTSKTLKQSDSFIISFLATVCVLFFFNNSGLLERGEKTVSGSPCPLFEKKTLLRGLNISLLYVHCSG